MNYIISRTGALVPVSFRPTGRMPLSTMTSRDREVVRRLHAEPAGEYHTGLKRCAQIISRKEAA